MTGRDNPIRVATLPDRAQADRARGDTAALGAHRLERLIGRLPERWRPVIRWLRQPAARWARVPAGILLIAGSLLAILPIFGLWMLPLGLILLAEDVPMLRRWRDRLLEWIERQRPHWFLPKPDAAAKAAGSPTKESRS